MQMQTASRLRIYIDDTDTLGGAAAYRWLVEKAHAAGLRGATVLRGTMGFGGHGEIHSSRVFALATDLPLVVEVIDEREKIDKYVADYLGELDKGAVTIESVEAAFPG